MEKKYTPKRFAESVSAYFDGITRTQPLIVAAPDLVQGDEPGEYKARREIFGRPALKYVQPVTKDGNAAQVEEYIIQPTVSGLCLFLGISHQTWAKYAKEKGYRETVERARLRIETHLQDLLMVKNSANGAKFSLEHNFGWGAKAAGETQDGGEPAEEMTIGEKMALLREMGLQVPGMEDCRAAGGGSQ